VADQGRRPVIVANYSILYESLPAHRVIPLLLFLTSLS
jgi:hypothetical protein